MAEKQKTPLGPTGETLVRNLKRIRESRRLTYVELSGLLAAEGRPIPVLGLRRIERGERRVDADDLVALAAVLGKTPNTLLLPPEVDDQVISLTPETTVTAEQAWAWATGSSPLPSHETYSVERARRFRSENSPHNPPDEATLADLERHAEDLKQLEDAFLALRADGLSSASIKAYLGLRDVIDGIMAVASAQAAAREAAPDGSAETEALPVIDNVETDEHGD